MQDTDVSEHKASRASTRNAMSCMDGHVLPSAATTVERVGREHDERDEEDGGHKRDGCRAPYVPAELVVDVADLVPVHMRVPLQAEVGDRACSAGG